MQDNTPPSKENYTVALSGLIFGALSLICAFIPNWLGFAIILGIAAVLVSAFSLLRSRAVHSKKLRAIAGLVLGILGIVAGALHKYMAPDPDKNDQYKEPVPVELQDTTAMQQDHSDALNKLQTITDSNTAQ